LATYTVVIDTRDNGRMDVRVEADSPLEAEDLAEEVMRRDHPEIRTFEVLGAVPPRR
jgi:hypothetical protein